jgi:hypothetical protein
MKPEPKSIVTSDKGFGSQLNREQTTPPQNPSFSPSNIPPSPNTLQGGIERETGLPTRLQQQQQAATPPVDPANTALDFSPHLRHSTGGGDTANNEQNSVAEPFEDSFRKPLPLSSPPLSNTTPNASKHPRSEDSGTRAVSTSERSSKRTRPKLRPRHTLDAGSFTSGKKLTPKVGSPPSPLFFSHTPRPRPIFPPTFSSSEAGATMLNKAKDEPGGVTTLKLARGSVSNTASPARSTGTPNSWASFERSRYV